MTNTDDLRAMIAFANATGRGVEIPAGVYDIDYPVRVPLSGVFVGAGRNTVRFRRAPDRYTPSVLFMDPENDAAPVLEDGLHPDTRGWFSLFDYWTPNQPTGQVCFEIAFTLDAIEEGVERTLAWAGGCLYSLAGPDTPFSVTVIGTTLKVKIGVAVYEFVATVASGVLTRVVVQSTGTADHVWLVQGTTRTILAYAAATPLSWPRHCDLTIGANPTRFPEGVTGGLVPPAGVVIDRVSVQALCPYSVEAPPLANTTVPDHALGVWTNFGSPDGCLFRGTVAGSPAVFLWRAGALDRARSGGTIGGFTLEGQGRSPFGVYASGVHNWQLDDVVAYGHRYGVLFQSQCYRSTLSRLDVSNNTVGLALCNNSVLVTLDGLQAVGGNQWGVIASDADGLLVLKGWVANNVRANMVVKGDNADLTWVGGGIGFEGTPGEANVELFNLSAYSFLNTTFFGVGPGKVGIHAEECSGGDIRYPRFGFDPLAAGGIRTTDQDATRPVVVVEGRRFGSAGDAVPLFAPGST